MNEQALIVISVLALLAMLSLFSRIVILNKRNNDLTKELLKLRETSNESYVKFITDSRDWAFQYIEEVQTGLKKFADEIEPQLNYFNTYGRTVPSHNDIALDVITKSFSELKTLLPEENKEK
jgi:hypothetical protein